MKIDASTVKLAASHKAATRVSVKETVHARVSGPAATRPTPQSAPPVSAPPAAASSRRQAALPDVDADPLLYSFKLMVEMLSGRRIKTVSASDLQPVDDPSADQQPAPQQTQPQASVQSPATSSVQTETSRTVTVDESEQTQFRGTGAVHTADGRDISVDVALSMSCSLHEESTQTVQSGGAVSKDPLVINFGGAPAQLQDQRFSFDIDGDGTKDNVPLLGGNSGYLALDLNGNGKIDSGRELFGARSGDGFAELAAYDSDGNGWIDDNDPVFQQLQVWTPDAQGGGTLTGAKDMGVGAIYLGHADTPFALKGSANQDLGTVRGSGMYLSEDGKAGTLQQIDVTV